MIKLGLALETSSSTFGVAILSGPSIVSEDISDHSDTLGLDLRSMVLRALDRIAATPRDLELIAVDVGPGNLSAVRSGVSFANALATSIGIPVIGINSFELMALSCIEGSELPVLCVRKGSGGSLYAALVENGYCTRACYGSLAKVASLVASISELAVAGVVREELLRIRGEMNTLDTGVSQPALHSLLAYINRASIKHLQAGGLVIPITEQSRIFNE